MRNKGGGRAKKGKERRERGGKKKKGKSKRATITIRIPKTAPFYPASHSSSSLDALTLPRALHCGYCRYQGIHRAQ